MTLFLIGVTFGLLLAAIEWRRPVRWPLLRAVLVLLAVTALSGLGTKPTRAATATADLILTTPHATPAERDSARRLLPGARVLTIDSVQTVSTLQSLLGNGRLLLIGDGLPASWWPSLHGVGVAWLPPAAPLPSGFASIEAATVVPLGESWQVSGLSSDTTDMNPWVVAIGPDARRDSARVMAGRFSLALQPRAAGRWTWQLQHGPATATVGVTVAARAPRTVLLLAGAPSFELTALKRRLAERGDRAIVRVRAAKERVVAEYVNLPQVPGVVQVNEPLLRTIDHVVLVGRVQDAVTPPEAAALLAGIRGGLGIVRIIRDSAEVGDAATAASLPPGVVIRAEEQDTGTTGQTVRVRSLARSAPVPAAAIRFVTAGPALLRDASDRILAVQRPVGEGRIVGTVVTDAARWHTAGDTLSFDGYWRTLLDATTRPARQTPWQIDGDARVTAERVVTLSRLVAEDSVRGPVFWRVPSGRVDTLTPVRGGDDAARRVVAVVAHDTGWHVLASADTVGTIGVHVGSATLDAAREAAEARAATRRHAVQLAERGMRADDLRRTTLPLLSDTAWLLLFTAAAGLLWFLQRRDG